MNCSSVHCRYLHYNIMVRVHAHAALLRIQFNSIIKNKFKKLISIKWKNLNYLCKYISVSITRTENYRRKRKIQSWISMDLVLFVLCFLLAWSIFCPEKDKGRLKSMLRTFYVNIFLEICPHLHVMKDAQLMSTHSALGFKASFHWAVPCFILIHSIHVILWGHKYWFPQGFFSVVLFIMLCGCYWK